MKLSIYFTICFVTFWNALHALRCPRGSIAIAYNGKTKNANIDGCGIEGCDNRYKDRYQTLADCQNACNAIPECQSFSFSRKGADPANPDSTVCTLYDTCDANCVAPFPQILCKPIDKLVCPDGYQQVGPINSGVRGCGLTKCDERYGYNTIDECADECTRRRRRACNKNEKCRAFTFAPIGGDKSQRYKNVCSLYNKGRTNTKRGPSQIMCKPLRCPRGSKRIRGPNGENSIAGCGLTGCDKRYDIPTIQQCGKLCDTVPSCSSYSFAPVGGDSNYPGQTVCTLYDDDVPNQTTNDNQILCDKKCDIVDLPDRKCVISGDPHFSTFNGARHHFQGDKDALNQIFYLVTNCDINNKRANDFSILGRFRSFNGGKPTGTDYIILELYDDVDTYFVYLSYEIRQYVQDGPGVSLDYDENVANNVSMTTYVDGSTQIGSKFTIIVNTKNSNTVTLTLSISKPYGDPCNVDITFTKNTRRYSKVLGRTLMNKVYIDPPECYRCSICGLCGDCQTEYKKPEIRGCKGDKIKLNEAGKNIAKWKPNAMAYEASGLTWQKKYVDAKCIAPRPTGIPDPAVCDENIRKLIEPRLQAARDAVETCCRSIGCKFCDERQSEAEIDICLVCGTDIAVIDAEIQKEFTDKVLAECADKGGFGPVPKLLYEFQGDLKETMSGKTKYELRRNGEYDNNAFVGNGVLNCDGSGDYVFNIINLDFGISSYSLEVLVQINDLDSSGGGTIGVDSIYSDNPFYVQNQFDSIVYNPDGNRKFNLASENDARTAANNNNPETASNKFVQLVATYDVEKRKVKLYRNGVIQLDFEPTGEFLTAEADEGFRVMFCQKYYQAPGDDFDGKIRYGALYDYALTAQDVKYLYDNKIEGEFENMGNELISPKTLTDGQGLRSLNGEYIAVYENGEYNVYSINNGQYTDLNVCNVPNGYKRLIMGETGNLVAYDANNNIIYESKNAHYSSHQQLSDSIIGNKFINKSSLSSQSIYTYLVYFIGIFMVLTCSFIICYFSFKKNKEKYNKVTEPETDNEDNEDNGDNKNKQDIEEFLK